MNSRKFNCLPTKERFLQCISFSEHIQIFQLHVTRVHVRIFPPRHRRQNTRFSAHKLDLTFQNSRFSQKTLSYLGPRLWNSLPSQIKLYYYTGVYFCEMFATCFARQTLRHWHLNNNSTPAVLWFYLRSVRN